MIVRGYIEIVRKDGRLTHERHFALRPDGTLFVSKRPYRISEPEFAPMAKWHRVEALPEGAMFAGDYRRPELARAVA